MPIEKVKYVVSLFLLVPLSVAAETCYVKTLNTFREEAAAIGDPESRSSAIASISKSLVSHKKIVAALALFDDIDQPDERDLVRSDAVEAMVVSDDEAGAFAMAESHENAAFKIRSYAKLARYTTDTVRASQYLRLAESALVATPPGFWRERGCSNLADAYAARGDYERAFQRAESSCSGEFSARVFYGLAEIIKDRSIAAAAMNRGDAALVQLNDAHMQGKSQAERIGPLLKSGQLDEAIRAAESTEAYLKRQSSVDAAIGYADMASILWATHPELGSRLFKQAILLATQIEDLATRIEISSMVLLYIGRRPTNAEDLCF